MIEVRHLSKFYGENRAIEDISFTIQQGEVVGLLGPNGAGKSTIMKILTSYISHTSGTVLIGGLDVVENRRETSKCIGFLPEIPPLYIEMTVRDYLVFAAEIKGIPRRQRSAHIGEVMQLANIDGVKDRLIKNLSKGYRQRVGLAQALIGFPEILILDEPTVGLDPKQITEVRSLIKKLSERHTIILSSHILSEISAVCEKVIIINKGKMVAADTMENVMQWQGRAGNFVLELKADLQKAEVLLSQIEGLAGFRSAESQPDNSERSRFIVTAKEGADPREEIFYLMAKNDVPILQLGVAGVALEEVFLRLTSGGNPAQEVAE